MRTIKDLIGENRYIDEMNNLIDIYNNSVLEVKMIL